jgi:hypothetical protein
MAGARDEYIGRLRADRRQRLVQDAALLVIDRRVPIAVQDQVRRRVSVDTVIWVSSALRPPDRSRSVLG